jgi:hypothetical protein
MSIDRNAYAIRHIVLRILYRPNSIAVISGWVSVAIETGMEIEDVFADRVGRRG